MLQRPEDSLRTLLVARDSLIAGFSKVAHMLKYHSFSAIPEAQGLMLWMNDQDGARYRVLCLSFIVLQNLGISTGEIDRSFDCWHLEI